MDREEPTPGDELHPEVDLAWDVVGTLEGDAGQIVTGRAADSNQTEGTTDFIASTDDEDRAYDIVRQDWSTKSYKRSPVVLDSHRYDRPVGRGVHPHVPRSGEHAGRLLITAAWNLKSSDASIVAVGESHLNGFLFACSVGFRSKKMTRRNQLPKDHRFYADEVTISTPWGDYKRAGLLYEGNTLIELSSVTIPMNTGAVHRSFGAPPLAGVHLHERLAEIDPADLERRADVVAQTLTKETADALRAALPDLLADPATCHRTASLLWPEIVAQLRADETVRRIVAGWQDLEPPTPAPDPVPVTLRGDDLDFLFLSPEQTR